MDDIDYKKLYLLQDEVLEIIFQTEKIFYLTGGTCLSRFYCEKRYSDDLDLFTHDSPRYNFAIRKIKSALNKNFVLFESIESKDFTRIKINEILTVDFVNDFSYRHKDVIITDRGFIIDNIENILSNKLTAILGRDNPKDIFDVYVIWKFYSFSWKEILDAAHRKSQFKDEELIVRLKSFPKKLLEKLRITDPHFLDNFDSDYPTIVTEISHAVINMD